MSNVDNHWCPVCRCGWDPREHPSRWAAMAANNQRLAREVRVLKEKLRGVR